jgi:small neutral amino acid transporter SnatA (MarC family)
MIINIIISNICIVLAIVIAIGKGDMLIAGFNTASEEERKKVNIHRLRITTATILIVAAILSFILSFIGE